MIWWKKEEGELKMGDYIAHKKEKTGEIQTVKEHCENTALLCSRYAVPGWEDFLYNVGLLHDEGKYQQSFQRRIRGENLKVEHSGCGAQDVLKHYKNALGILAAYVIAGHHSGIPDGGDINDDATMSTLYGRLERKYEDYSACEELDMRETDEKKVMGLLTADCRTKEQVIDKFAFMTRYCFSCLVDADSQDTAAFCSEEDNAPFLNGDFEKCLERLNRRLESFVCQTDLQRARAALQKQAFQNLEQPAEIYLLNMPTGSGKTLASAKIALELACREKKKRIIYVIPFNAIVDQTADVFESIFQSDLDILRHQSTFSFENEEDKDEDYQKASRLAAENWECPFILTTAVQFFESLYGNKRGKLRKVHNMADSILVFDEAHLMPKEYLQPCLQSVAFITRSLHSKAVFLTATMPDFTDLITKYALPDSKIVDLIQDKSEFYRFKKCRFQYIGEVNTEELLRKSREMPSSLIVVNRKASARKLFQSCPGKKFHLSTYMTSEDRKRRLREIREELRLLEEDFPGMEGVPEERRITILSTSLIEAGVDLDVYTVFREMEGLDHILQAGGRCNREGKRGEADVFVFDFDRETEKTRRNQITDITKGLFSSYEDISDLDCIEEYYRRVFELCKEEIQKYTIHTQCNNIHSIPFKEYAEKFKMIKDGNLSLVVPQDEESRNLVEMLRYTKSVNIRKLQKYTCSVTAQEMEDLVNQHAADDFGTGVFCLTNTDYYDEEQGIMFESKDYFL